MSAAAFTDADECFVIKVRSYRTDQLAALSMSMLPPFEPIDIVIMEGSDQSSVPTWTRKND